MAPEGILAAENQIPFEVVHLSLRVVLAVGVAIPRAQAEVNDLELVKLPEVFRQVHRSAHKDVLQLEVIL